LTARHLLSVILLSLALAAAFRLGADPASPADSSSATDAAQVLRTLRPGHPRLFALDADIQRVRAIVASDPKAREWRDQVRAQAASLLAQPPLTYHLDGPRLLEVSREALRRIATLGLIYRLDGERGCADRAIRELMTVCDFQDWHPPHFLDTAEMTTAAAIGYDWLYPLLTPQQRALVKQAIVDKGLTPGLEIYEMNAGWVNYAHNWNQVCNGGMTVGALAIADEEPKLAARIVSYAVKSIPTSLAGFKPDGAWAEGPSYWRYATDYTVFFLAALQSALGNDFGLGDSPGLDCAGDFRIYDNGPNDLVFNFADASEGYGRNAQMFWFARRYHNPLYAWFERHNPAPPNAWALLWYDPEGDLPPDLPRDKWFRAADLAFLRSAWDDPNAVFIGFKGGENPVNHGHLDLGTFVLDAQGERWALDLGPDNYNLPGYFDAKPGGQRWNYYRMRTEGHNTLTLDGDNQALPCQAPIVAFRSAPERAFVVADLSAAYPKTKRLRRGIALLDRKHVLVQDEIETADGPPSADGASLASPVDLVWAMHTRAKVAVDSATAALTQNGKTLTARILSPAGAVFATASADPGAPQARNEGVTKLVVRLPALSGATRLAVVLSTDVTVAPALAPLDDWVALGRVQQP
jgi:hypothetical protein